MEHGTAVVVLETWNQSGQSVMIDDTGKRVCVSRVALTNLDPSAIASLEAPGLLV